MRTLVYHCSRSATALNRRSICHGRDNLPFLFTCSTPRIRLARQYCLSSSMLSSSTSSSSPSFGCCEGAAPRKIGEGIEDDVVSRDVLNTQKTVRSLDLRKSEDEDDDDDDDEHGYSGIGSSSSHIPVLLSEVLAAFQDVQLHTFVDCTLGAAGHASAIIMSHRELRSFVGLDVDPAAHSEASSRLQEAINHRTKSCANSSHLQLHVLKANFKNLKTALHQLGLESQEVDGVLMDLGMSSMQLNFAERGFSLQLDGPLDMRMDPMASITASDILNGWPEAEIGRILREYGEERQWRRLAQRITEARHLGGIHSTSGLLQLIQRSLPARFSPGRAGWKKTAIRVFQALRIAVNDELSSLKVALPDAFACLKPGGRLAVLSFHSLEDRIVKQFFLKVMGECVVNKTKKRREYNSSILSSVESQENEPRTKGMKLLEGTRASILTRRPLIAGLDEVKLNPRARSAKLRILVKK